MGSPTVRASALKHLACCLEKEVQDGWSHVGESKQTSSAFTLTPRHESYHGSCHFKGRLMYDASSCWKKNVRILLKERYFLPKKEDWTSHVYNHPSAPRPTQGKPITSDTCIAMASMAVNVLLYLL